MIKSRHAGAFSRLREKAGDEGAASDPHPSPLPQAGEGEGSHG